MIVKKSCDGSKVIKCCCGLSYLSTGGNNSDLARRYVRENAALADFLGSRDFCNKRISDNKNPAVAGFRLSGVFHRMSVDVRACRNAVIHAFLASYHLMLGVSVRQTTRSALSFNTCLFPGNDFKVIFYDSEIQFSIKTAAASCFHVSVGK